MSKDKIIDSIIPDNITDQTFKFFYPLYMETQLPPSNTKKSILIAGVIFIIFLIGLYFLIKPAKQMKKIRNAHRQDDIYELTQLINKYSEENEGKIPEMIKDEPALIGSLPGQNNICALIVPKYASSLPYDKNFLGAYYANCERYNLGYTVSKDSNGKIVVKSPGVE